MFRFPWRDKVVSIYAVYNKFTQLPFPLLIKIRKARIIELYPHSTIPLALRLYTNVYILRKLYLSQKTIILSLFSGPPSNTRVRKDPYLHIISSQINFTTFAEFTILSARFSIHPKKSSRVITI